MKKRYLALTMALALAATSTAFASPLKNYDPGHFSVDAGISLPTSVKAENYKLSKDNSAYFGATAGIGSNMALNYKWNNFKSDEARTRMQQLNLMYKLVPGVSAYAGYVNTSTNHGGKDNNGGQVGLQAAYDIPLLFTVWGNVGVGNKNSGYEIGLSKALLNNVELNASYYDQKINDAFADDVDLKAKGVNLGVTVKF